MVMSRPLFCVRRAARTVGKRVGPHGVSRRLRLCAERKHDRGSQKLQ